jgi:hypothetical protein
MKWKSAIKGAKSNSELARIRTLLNDKLKLKKNINSGVKNAGKKKVLLHQIMAYKNDTANRRKQMLALPAPKPVSAPVNKFANQKALSKYLQNLKMNRSDRTKFVARLKTTKLNVVKANAKKFMKKPSVATTKWQTASTRAVDKAKANAKRKANINARRAREKQARIAKASQPRVARKTKKVRPRQGVVNKNFSKCNIYEIEICEHQRQ